MRINPDLSSTISAAIQQTQQSLDTATSQLASGKRVSSPTDDPLAYTQQLADINASSNVDRYTKSADAVQLQAQTADAALSSVVQDLTQAVSIGTQGANGTLTSSDRSTLADQVRSILKSVVAQANSTSGGASIFAGTASTAAAFVSDTNSPTGYSYQGNSGVNQAVVGDDLVVPTNIPGSQIFTSPQGNVIQSLSQLAQALDTGTASDVGAAIKAVSGAITHVSAQRVLYGNTVNQLSAQESFLSQETLTLSSQQQSLTGVDLSTAATNLTQAQTAHTAVLAAAAKILPVSLLDYLK